MPSLLTLGDRNVEFSAPVPLASHTMTTHKTFMDTIGRPTLILTVFNAVDEWRDRGDVVVSYDYPWLEPYRKPGVFAASVFGIFFALWLLGNIDISIGKRKTA